MTEGLLLQQVGSCCGEAQHFLQGQPFASTLLSFTACLYSLPPHTSSTIPVRPHPSNSQFFQCTDAGTRRQPGRQMEGCLG